MQQKVDLVRLAVGGVIARNKYNTLQTNYFDSHTVRNLDGHLICSKCGEVGYDLYSKYCSDMSPVL